MQIWRTTQGGVPGLQQEGQDLLQNSASRLRHSGRGVRLVLAARSDENVYGFLCLRLRLEHQDKSGRRLHLETSEWHMPIWALGRDAVSRGRCGVQTHLPPKNGSSNVAPVENPRGGIFPQPSAF